MSRIVTQKRKREQVMVACGHCRQNKAKCNGDRPVCHRCRERSLECQYSADADACPIVALKRKYSALNEAYIQQGWIIGQLKTQLEINGTERPFEVAKDTAYSENLLVNKPDNRSTQLSATDTVSSTAAVRSRLLQSQRDTEVSVMRTTKILRTLAFSSNAESNALFTRIRSGEDWFDIAESLSSEEVVQPSQDQRDAHFAQDGAWPAENPWLSPLFDRQYFFQVRYMPCFPGPYTPHMLPDTVTGFGNLSFSSAVAANHYPPHIQQMQQHNMHAPVWDKAVLNGDTALADPLELAFVELVHSISMGVPAGDICGPHVYLAALDDADVYCRAPKLSQLVARAIRSIKTTETSATFTQYAMMYWFWALWRWMLMRTEETYRDIPAFARPTPSQLLLPHPATFDFILTPGLRDLMCQTDTPNIQWFTEAAITIQCVWTGSLCSAICKDGLSNEIDINPICKRHMSTENNWTLGSSVRPVLSVVDAFVNIR